jgi:insertion element IS1 protein InsB|tara:strand:+ start:97 stop:831 length:735 start_codon:yes stop_codon:yes gene_type:complete
VFQKYHFGLPLTIFMNCRYCKGACVKRGARSGVQKYSCKLCKKYQQTFYQRKPLTPEDRISIKLLNSERVSFRGIGRVLKCSASTIQRNIRLLALKVEIPWRGEFNQVYEIDEMCSYVSRNKNESRIWITYAINRRTKDVISVVTGRRNNDTISKVTESVLSLHPKTIFTDKYVGYSSLIPRKVHSTKKSNTNCIERMNLTIRNRISRFSRKTLSFPKSKEMTEACVLLFFDQIGWTFQNVKHP